ncbi:DUF397 domain-containing protein [Streptomyces phaeochromogenes]|uniref:DUF397 domain-containing protein n=1 Tax=Streptomyces phaeochromogenes TaxID=1923 RepID=UPI0033E3630A
MLARAPGDRAADRSRAPRTGVSVGAWLRNVQGREPAAPFRCSGCGFDPTVLQLRHEVAPGADLAVVTSLVLSQEKGRKVLRTDGMWVKSSHSESGACVEVSLQGRLSVRDSKDPHIPGFSLDAMAWSCFVAALRAADSFSAN